MDGPQKVGNLLGNLRFIRWMRAWRRCAGAVILKQSRFHGVWYSQGVLTLHIEVPDAVWRQELVYQKKELLERFRQALKEELVPEHEWPNELSLSGAFRAGQAAVPLKSGHPKKSRNE